MPRRRCDDATAAGPGNPDAREGGPLSRAYARRCAVRWGLALACAAPALPAFADQPLWELGAGVAALRLPHYRGSDQTDDWVLPVPYAVYRGRILRADRDGARAVLFDSERVDFDLSVAASAPTKSRDDLARQGMSDLAPTVEIGPKLNLALARGDGWKLDLRAPVRAVVTLESRPRHIGWTVSPVLNLDVRGRAVDFGMQAGPLWGDRRLHAYYYDVAPADATASRPAYRASGGRAGWQATLGASRRIGRLWMGAFVRADSVAGAAFESSPLVRRRQQWAFGMALSWVFAVSQRTVPDAPEPGW
jgi:MipA family protein